MSKKYTITLSDAEDKALGSIAISQKDWIDNIVHNRCRIAIDEIVNAEVQRKLEAGEAITGSKEDIVIAADIKSAAEKNEEILAQIKIQQEAAPGA